MPQTDKLGRGLDSITKLPDGGPQEEVKNLSVDLIDPNPNQPREVFDPEALSELEASIAIDGILQPIMVRPAGGRYQVVMGERRLRAGGKHSLRNGARRPDDTKHSWANRYDRGFPSHTDTNIFI